MKFIFENNVPSVLLMTLVLLANAQRSSNNLRDSDFQELARQNKITKQILEAFIQKKLGLSRGHVRPPSVHEILPKNMVGEKNARPPDLGEETEEQGEVQQTQEFPEDDSLQSVESEQIDSIYSEGKTKKYIGPPFEPELDHYRKIYLFNFT